MRSILWGAAVLLLAGGASADIIKLKNGRSIEGDVIADDGRTVTIKIPGGSFQLDRSEIASIQEKPTPEQEHEARMAALAQEYKARVAALDASDAQAQLELAQWAESVEFDDKALEHYLAAWKCDHDLVAAQQALEERGWHLVGEEWQDTDTYYAGLGWVRVGYGWVHPLEHALDLENERLAAARGRLGAAQYQLASAQAVRRKAEQLAAAAAQMLQDIPARRAQVQLRIVELQADREAAARDWQNAALAVDRWERIWAEERGKADRDEPNRVLEADGELWRARRWLSEADAAVARWDAAIVEEHRSLAGLPAAESAAQADLGRAQADAESADGRVAEALELVGRRKAEVDQQAAKATQARAAWDAAK